MTPRPVARGPDAGPLALTMGEPAGIGGEITLLAWQARSEVTPPFFVIDDPDRLAALAARLGLDIPLHGIDRPADAIGAFASALPVCPEPLSAAVEPGRPIRETAGSVIRSIDRAVTYAQTGEAAAVVTNPIHKASLMEAGFSHPGHTEYLAELTRAAGPPVMMLACDALRVVPVTIHQALHAAVAALTPEAIVHCGRVTAGALSRDFGLAQPRLAIAGLNPHAGEAGHLGDEEIRIITPAIEALRGEGLTVSGPHPADTMFHAAARRSYDAAICMYHDQALIPIKTIDFDGGVNVTLGLPIVRTSPDHGTAFDIAGTGQANPRSLLAALATAGTMAASRRRHEADLTVV